MKREPLKGKIQWIAALINKDYVEYRQKPLFFATDVEAAYQWYKWYREDPFALLEAYPEYQHTVFSFFRFCGVTLDSFKVENKVNGFDSSYWMEYDHWLLEVALSDLFHFRKEIRS